MNPTRQPLIRQLRAMQEGDLDWVLAIEQSVYPQGWSRGIFLDCIASGYLCRIAEDPQGRGYGYAISSAAVGELHILNIAIDTPHQGLGLGRQLLQAVLDEGCESRAERAFLEVRASNLVARRLYASIGFLEVGVRRGYYPAFEQGEREDALVLALALT